MKKINKDLYEKFHKNTTAQTKIIKRNNFTYNHLISTIEKYLQPFDSILDIGCGAGTLLFYFANTNHEVFGIDTSESAVQACKNSVKNMNFKNTTFQMLHFPDQIPDKKFDFIICSEVIEHIPNDQLALEKIYRLLKKDGIAVISTPSLNAPLHKLGYTKAHDKRVGHLRRYSIEKIN